MFIIQLRMLLVEHQEIVQEVVAITEGFDHFIGNEKEMVQS